MLFNLLLDYLLHKLGYVGLQRFSLHFRVSGFLDHAYIRVKALFSRLELHLTRDCVMFISQLIGY